MSFNDLSKYAVDDVEKIRIIEEILQPKVYLCESIRLSSLADAIPCTKFCPECGCKFPENEIFCFNCLVKLKEIRQVNIKDIEIKPQFSITKSNEWKDFADIFSQENIDRIKEFNFNFSDFKRIIKGIKKTVLKTLDGAIKDNDIFLDNLNIADKVLLFAKSFVNVGYKGYGAQLGYFEFNRICVDDRQLPALQITTILHELSHFLLAEIIAEIICEILDCSKTSQIESIAIFILSYSLENQLIDEYAAHTVEGRFTLFGYQDYSSFLSIQNKIDLPKEDIEMIKTIGNSFSYYIKEILESFIDDDLLDDIKTQFKEDILDRPNYEHLSLENCQLLNSQGLVEAIRLVVQDGFLISMDNVETLEKYNQYLE